MLTVQEAGKGNQAIPDEEVLNFAIQEERAILTLNRYDFIQLHRLQPNHSGIIVCTNDSDRNRMSQRLHEAISQEENLANFAFCNSRTWLYKVPRRNKTKA
ncbi:MAG: DUF5615 family PIN-like protein [Dolichospermum sp.]